MAEPFFVATTGRSGSRSLALALNQHPLLCAMHEPYPVMIEWAYQRHAESGLPARIAMISNFQAMFPHLAVQRVGIVDQKTVQFIGDLAAAFPQAQFIWLVRDGRDVVASGLARGWYSEQEARFPPHLWAKYRLRGDVAGDVDAETWAAMSPFARNCWYWAWTQRQIRKRLAALSEGPGERWQLVRLEDLNRDALVLLQEWLGVQPLDLAMLHTNAGVQERVRAARWRTWTDEQRATFARICGEEMDQLYSWTGWREDLVQPVATAADPESTKQTP